MLLARAVNNPEKGVMFPHGYESKPWIFFPCHLNWSLTIVVYSVVQEGPLELVESGQGTKKN